MKRQLQTLPYVRCIEVGMSSLAAGAQSGSKAKRQTHDLHGLFTTIHILGLQR